jgi:hypothetical protein
MKRWGCCVKRKPRKRCFAKGNHEIREIHENDARKKETTKYMKHTKSDAREVLRTSGSWRVAA